MIITLTQELGLGLTPRHRLRLGLERRLERRLRLRLRLRLRPRLRPRLYLPFVAAQGPQQPRVRVKVSSKTRGCLL